MFYSYFFYQITDLVLGFLLAAGFDRCLPRGLTQASQARFPRALSSPFRRLWLLEFPLFAALSLCLMILCNRIAFPLLLWFTTTFFQPYTFSTFLNLGVAYYSFVVVFPVLALRRAKGGEKPLAVATLFAALGFFGYATLWTPNQLVVEQVEVELEDWPANQAPLKIAVLADLQSPLLTRRERHAVEIANDLQPDLIVLPGDLVGQSLKDELPVACARYVVDHLRAPLGVFAVNGDVDMYVAGGLGEILEGTKAALLSNRSIVLPTEPPIELGGFDPMEPTRFLQALVRPERAVVRIGLVHRPRHGREIGRAGYDLVIGGHTHGGQVSIPGFGPPLTLSPLPRRIAAGGLHSLPDGGQLYVSRGVGLEVGFAPLLRLFCPPEITLLRLGPPRDKTGKNADPSNP